MSENEIDHHGTNEVVCPFCGQTHDGDSVFDGVAGLDTELECDQCGKTFEVLRDFSVCYYTDKLRNDTSKG